MLNEKSLKQAANNNFMVYDCLAKKGELTQRLFALLQDTSFSNDLEYLHTAFVGTDVDLEDFGCRSIHSSAGILIIQDPRLNLPNYKNIKDKSLFSSDIGWLNHFYEIELHGHFTKNKNRLVVCFNKERAILGNF